MCNLQTSLVLSLHLDEDLLVGHSSWKCLNSLHLKHLLLSLLISLPETLGVFGIGAFVKFTKGSSGLECSSVTKSSTSISSVAVEAY